MRQINLLPPEIRARRQARRFSAILAAGVGALILLLLLVYAIQLGRLSSARNDLEAQQRVNSRLETQVRELSRFSELQQELTAKRALLVALTENEVRWSVILSNVATVIPADVWLTGFTGSVAVQAQAPGAAPTAATIGQVQFSGCTLLPADGTHLEVAKWLVRIGVPEEFLRPFLSLSSKGTDTCPVTFNSTVSLSQDALRKNQRGGERRP